MFTGIVETTGSIHSTSPTAKGACIEIAAGSLDMSDVRIGDSIAVDGCCLTVIEKTALGFRADVSEETMNCTTGFALGRVVNLEKALRLSDRLGGHLVSGHVDGVGEVTRFQQIGESSLLEVRVPPDLAKYVARKGSITISGVSLTVNHVEGDRFDVNLIPHTLELTNLKVLKAGSRVNLEVDLVARYLERMLESGSSD
jgi:riboflavin synthase